MNEYIDQTFQQQYQRFGRCVRRADTDAMLPKPRKPSNLLREYREQGHVYGICPVFNKLTHMWWVEVDNHNGYMIIPDKVTHKTASTIHTAFLSVGLHPEWALSSPGSHRIVGWCSTPQSCYYVKTVLKGFLASIGMAKRAGVEIGPKDGMNLTPWHFKPQGWLIKSGQQDIDLSVLQEFHTQKRRCVGTPRFGGKAFPIHEHIPDGETKKTNDCRLSLIREGIKYGLTDEQILEYGRYQFENGVVNTNQPMTVERHLKCIQSGLKGAREYFQGFEPTRRLSNIIAEAPTGMDLLTFAKYVRDCMGKDVFPLPCRDMGKYLGISHVAAFKQLEKLVLQGKLVLEHEGSSGTYSKDSNLYSFPAIGSI